MPSEQLKNPSIGLSSQDPTTQQQAVSGLSPELQQGVQASIPSPLKLTVPNTLPSTVLGGDNTYADAFAKRNDLQMQSDTAQSVTRGFNNIQGMIDTQPTGMFSNPEVFINNLLLRRPVSDAENQRNDLLRQSSENIQGIGGRIETAQNRAENRYDVAGIAEGLAATRSSIAERTKKLREDLRAFEVNAKERGVARNFVDAEKGKLQADAAAELADLSIIESAQLGNLEEARGLVAEVIDQKIQAFQLEQAGIEAEIKRLEPQLNEESQLRKTQLEIALQERGRIFEQQIANEKETREYMAEAAANGADQGTLDAIRNAATPGEAALLAGPWIGRMDRMQAEASMAASWASVRARNAETRLSQIEAAMAGDQASIDELGYDPNDMAGGVEGARQYETQKADIQTGIQAAQSLLSNTEGLNLSTGAFQSPFLAAATQAIGGGTAGGAAVGSVVPGVGTLAGGAAGLGAGVAATPFFYSRTKTNKDQFLSDAAFLINDTTFKEIIDLKAQGVTFGQMTEGERIAAGRAASQLAAAAKIDESGLVTGFRGDPDKIKGYVEDLLVAYEGRQEYLDTLYAIKSDEEKEAKAIWNE